MNAVPIRTADAMTLSGNWVGGYGIPGGWRFMLLNLELAPTGVLRPRVDVLFEGDARLDDLGFGAEHVSFTLVRGAESLRFEGERDGETIVGVISSANWRGSAVLLRTPVLNDSRPYRGTYQLADGRLVSVFALEGFYIPGQLATVEFPSGEVRLLFPTAEGSLIAGPGFFVPLPAERTFEFTDLDDRGFQRVQMRGADAGEIEGKRLRLREEEIRFRSGDVTLVGTLVLPPGDGPHPAVVIAHGSGDAVRDDPFAYVLAQRGLAFFRYDKRGVGESGGDWHTASFEVLADDVVAALRSLGERADIDSSRLGIWGWSQGGWIAPLAAVRATNVAFLVLQVPPAVSPAEQEIDRVEHELGADGFSRVEIDEAVEFMHRKAAYARSGQGWADFEPLLERSAKTRWFPYAGSPMQPDSWGWAFFRLINDYDPIPVLERIRCPVLALFGALDQNVVPAINVPLLEAGLRRAGNRLLTLKVFPNASHGLLECREGGPKELPLMRRYVPGYMDTLLDWLDATANLPTR